jgi:hypothetical protein
VTASLLNSSPVFCSGSEDGGVSIFSAFDGKKYPPPPPLLPFWQIDSFSSALCFLVVPFPFQSLPLDRPAVWANDMCSMEPRENDGSLFFLLPPLRALISFIYFIVLFSVGCFCQQRVVVLDSNARAARGVYVSFRL